MSNIPTPVTDLLSNFNDQKVTAANLLGRSKNRRAIFKAVYRGKKQIKTIKEIMKETGLSQTHVLKEGGKMAGLLFEKVSNGYKKKKDFAPRYQEIINLSVNKKKLKNIPTKTSPQINSNGLKVNFAFPSSAQRAKGVSIDDIKSFSKVIGVISNIDTNNFREEKIKEGFKKIIREKGSFKDWGGEKSDLYTTKVYLKNTRIATAIAFKGRGTKGKLVPSKMGKSGDQIERLFSEPAQLFLVVYNGQIESSIISQMQAFAIGKAISGKIIYYGVIDGDDLSRLASAYPDYF